MISAFISSGVDANSPPTSRRDASPRHPQRVRKRFGRYRFRRRLAPQPRRYAGFGAYRLVIANGQQYVIGPTGRSCEELQRWVRSELASAEPEIAAAGVRRRKHDHDPFGAQRRLGAALDGVRLLLDAVNTIHVDRPKVMSDLLDGKSAPTRDAIKLLLRVWGCHVKKAGGRNGGILVRPPSSGDHWRIGVTLARLRGLFDFWREEGIRTAHNPLQMDPGKSRLADGERSKVRKGPERWWLDVDSLFRVRQLDRQAPRPGDERIFSKVLARGTEMGWPEEAALLFEGMYLTGARLGQLSAATAHGLLVAARDDRHLALVQKGSAGVLTWQARTPPAWRAKVLAMLAKRVEGGMAEIERMAASKSAIDRAALRSIYLFSPDGRAPMPAWRAARLLRLVVEDLGLRFKIAAGDDEPVTKWFTSHWFRHGFVNRMLDRIAASTLDEAGRQGARSKLAAYMGWRHPEDMLAYYGRHHFEQEVDLLVAEHQDDLNAQLYESMEDEIFPGAANDNSIWAEGRASGGDLLD